MITFVVALWRPESYFRWVEPWLRLEQERHDAQIVLTHSQHSIFAAYQRGREAAKHDIIAYVHDDVRAIEPETVSPFLVDLFRRRRNLGLVGPAGKKEFKRVPWWLNAGRYVGHWCRFQGAPGEVIYQWADTASNLCPAQPIVNNFVMPPAPSQVQLKECESCHRAPCTCSTALRQRRGSRRYRRTLTATAYQNATTRTQTTGFEDVARAWRDRPAHAKWDRTEHAGLVDGFFLVEHQRRMPDWDVAAYGETAWHGYDVDRCFQAHATGRTVACTPLLLLHANEGHKKYGNAAEAAEVVYRDAEGRVCRSRGDELWLGDLDRINGIVRERWGCA